MGLVDKLFNGKEETEEILDLPEENQKEELKGPIIVSKEIESILLILENLGLLEEKKIKERISKERYYEEEILKEMKIKTSEENISHLKKYFETLKLGYGTVKIHQLRKKFQNIVAEKIGEGKNKEEIVKELISVATLEVENYEKVLKEFNQTVIKLEENEISDAEMIAMMDFWTNYYKEQSLGYPINLDLKVDIMARELSQLPFGGYGEEELRRFRSAASKMIEEARQTEEESNHTLNRIVSTLFNPKKNRYLADVETLKRKLQMITESPYLSDIEKEKNRHKTIEEFNEMNGHSPNMKDSIEQFCKNLKQLEFGGYGEAIVKEFEARAKKISESGVINNFPQEEINSRMEKEYNYLIEEYNKAKQNMLSTIKTIEENYEEPLRKLKCDEVVDEFHERMGHTIHIRERINNWILRLKKLDEDGYGELKLGEFKKKSVERVKKATTSEEIVIAIQDVRRLYEQLVDDYFKELQKVRKAIEKVEQSALKEEEKASTIDEFMKDFKFNLGYRMNFEKQLETSLLELKSLPHGGYGEKALEELKESCTSIINGVEDERTKYHQIRQKMSAFKKHYLRNLEIFKRWEKLQLEAMDDLEKEEGKKHLEEEITHMLSLSPNDLKEYYLADEKKKKEEMDRHNYMVAMKYLAKEEAKKKQDRKLYEERLKELENGQTPYSKKEIEEATTKLEMLKVTKEDFEEEEKIISVIDYIDSTLLRQMLYAESLLASKDN